MLVFIMRRLLIPVSATIILLALVCSGRIYSASANPSIYIRANGTIDPPSAPISTLDNITYVLTGNISDRIVVQRNSIIIDGHGFTVTDPGSGFQLQSNNTTIKNTRISGCYAGIDGGATVNNTVTRNNITGNTDGAHFGAFSKFNTISANNITQNSYGILLTGSTNNTVSSNQLTNNACAVRCEEGSENNTVTVNNMTYNIVGVDLEKSYHNTVSGNRIFSNETGVWLAMSTFNRISGNDMAVSWYGIDLAESAHYNDIIQNNITGAQAQFAGIHVRMSVGNNITGNRLTGNVYGMNLEASSDSNTIQANSVTNGTRGIYLKNSASNVIDGNTATSNLGDSGIELEDSSFNTVSNNNLTNNKYGLHIDGDNNTATGNTMALNSYYGIWLDYASYNTISHNRFIGNVGYQAYVESSATNNFWDDGYPSGGNFWSDYTGTDLYNGLNQNQAGSDGIGDTAYTINTKNQDHYPIIPEFEILLLIPLLAIVALFTASLKRTRPHS
jgi:parallel beta-helix repeat protein